MERPIRYMRESFVNARDFDSDEDLNARAELWLSSPTCGSTVPPERSRSIASQRATRCAVRGAGAALPLPGTAAKAASTPDIPLPRVQVERRPLKTYATIAAGAL